MRSGRRMLSELAAVMLLASALIGGAYASCASCGGSAWGGAASMGISWADELSSAVTTTSTENASSTQTASESDAAIAAESDMPTSTITAAELLDDQNGDTRLVTAYVGVPGDASYIEGSIHLPLAQVFSENGSIRSPAEIAAIFGAAGITEADPLVIYGDFFVNGYDTFAFWIMKYIGHEDVVLLEGTRADREAAGLEFVATSTPRASAVYNPAPNLDLLAGDDLLATGQLVDARSPEEYAADHLDGAINIYSLTVMGADGLADDDALASAFSVLDKESPVVAYSSKGGEASIVWYALRTHGYEASLFTLGSQS